MQATHTPLPWHAGASQVTIYGNQGATFVARLNESATPPDEVAANTKFIVLAVNSHDKLLAACKEALEWLVAMKKVLVVPDDQLPESYRAFVRQIQQAIAQAEGKS